MLRRMHLEDIRFNKINPAHHNQGVTILGYLIVVN